MIVTKIIPISKTKYKICLDNDVCFALFKAEVNRLDLKEDCEIEDEKYEYILEEILKKRAISRCNHLLADQEKTECQLRESLSRSNYPCVVIDFVIDYLKEKNYINDRRYVENYISYYKEKKGFNYIKLNLMKKGVSGALIDEFLEEIDDEDQVESLRKLINKKWKSETAPDYESEQKLKAFLVRKGYSISLVNKTIKDMLY